MNCWDISQEEAIAILAAIAVSAMVGLIFALNEKRKSPWERFELIFFDFFWATMVAMSVVCVLATIAYLVTKALGF